MNENNGRNINQMRNFNEIKRDSKSLKNQSVDISKFQAKTKMDKVEEEIRRKKRKEVERRKEEALEKQIRDLDARIDQYIDLTEYSSMFITKHNTNKNQGFNSFFKQNKTIQNIVSIPKKQEINIFDQILEINSVKQEE